MSGEKPRRILAMGGGGFTSDPRGDALDDLVLDLAGRGEPRILFLPTASGDPGGQIARFSATFSGRPCRPTVLSLFRLAEEDRPLGELLFAQDLIYVGGGSMRNLLAIWREHALDELLREAWERGVVLAGLSAGAMCWMAGGVTRSGGRAEPIAGLGLLPFSMSVHDDSEPERAPVFRDAVARGTLPPGFAADDGVGLVFEDEQLVRAVAARPSAKAVWVEGTDERPLELEQLTERRVSLADAPFAVRELRALRTAGLRRAG